MVKTFGLGGTFWRRHRIKDVQDSNLYNESLQQEGDESRLACEGGMLG